MSDLRTSKERNVCQFDPLVFGTIQAGFHRPSLGGSPVLTITDQEAVGEPEVCLSIFEARALHEWLNGVLGAAETSEPLIDWQASHALAVAQRDHLAEALREIARRSIDDCWCRDIARPALASITASTAVKTSGAGSRVNRER